jgi:hypothetical protein
MYHFIQSTAQEEESNVTETKDSPFPLVIRAIRAHQKENQNFIFF